MFLTQLETVHLHLHQRQCSLTGYRAVKQITNITLKIEFVSKNTIWPNNDGENLF